MVRDAIEHDERSRGISFPSERKKKIKPFKRDLLIKRHEKKVEKAFREWETCYCRLVATRNVLLFLSRRDGDVASCPSEIGQRRKKRDETHLLKHASMIHRKTAIQYVGCCFRWRDLLMEHEDNPDQKQAARKSHRWPPFLEDEPKVKVQWGETFLVDISVDSESCMCNMRGTGEMGLHLSIFDTMHPSYHSHAARERVAPQSGSVADVDAQQLQRHTTGPKAKKSGYEYARIVRDMIQEEFRRLIQEKGIDLVLDVPKVVLGIPLPRQWDSELEELIRALLHFQIRAYKKDPYKAKKTRRLVMGLREVARAVHLKKAKLLIFARNIETHEEGEGLHGQASAIVQDAGSKGIAVLSASSRQSLGKILRGGIQVGSVAILDYSGAEDKYLALMRKLQDMHG